MCQIFGDEYPCWRRVCWVLQHRPPHLLCHLNRQVHDTECAHPNERVSSHIFHLVLTSDERTRRLHPRNSFPPTQTPQRLWQARGLEIDPAGVCRPSAQVRPDTAIRARFPSSVRSTNLPYLQTRLADWGLWKMSPPDNQASKTRLNTRQPRIVFISSGLAIWVDRHS
jgi:hypothetical protein